MKRLMYIYPYDNEQLTKELKTEHGVAYSESISCFICYEDIFGYVNEKYGLETADEGDYTLASTNTLMDTLESMWDEEEYIKFESDFGRYESFEHNLGGDVETALQSYEDDSYDKWSENANELLSSNDWYKKLFKEIRITMLHVVLDSLKLNVIREIRSIESE